MQLTILTFGARGDIQPLVTLGKGLLEAGFAVRLAAPPRFQQMSIDAGLSFIAVPFPVWLWEKPRTLTDLLHIVKKYFNAFFDGCWQACQGSDAILFGTFGEIAGYHIAEKLDIPLFGTIAVPTKVQLLYLQGTSWRERLARRKRVIREQIRWQVLRPLVNNWRRSQLGLKNAPFFGIYTAMRRQQVPIFAGYSSYLLPKPASEPPWLHIVGYWQHSRNLNWQPPVELSQFLDAGPPPVYVGFGSMYSEAPEELTNLVIAALQQIGCRGILHVRDGGAMKQTHASTKQIYFAEYIPFDWLFPLTSAIVTHGGTGTTHHILCSGKPAIFVPFMSDQFLWANQVRSLGVGIGPLPYKSLTIENLAAAIERATTDITLQNQAQMLGELIRSEKGVDRTIALLKDYLS